MGPIVAAVSVETAMFTAAGLTLAGVFASKLSSRFGIPALLLFLAIGVLAGTDGPGGMEFDDAAAAQAVGVVALALILFDGGLGTRWDVVRPVVGPGAALASVSVAVTAGVTGAAAAWLLDLPLEIGLLLGSIVSSTDAAAVFSVLRSRRTGLQRGIQPTLELESGANDPMAVFLTIGLVDIATGAADSWTELVPTFAAQAGIGTVLGLVGGVVGRFVLNRIDLGTDGLYPVLSLTLAALTFSGSALAGGSGFLAVYLCGLWLGNNDVIHGRSIARFHDATAWLAQIAMFLVLGLLVTPSRLPEIAGTALAVTAVLVFVARPAAVALALTPLRVPWRDQTVVAWIGLRGATPIILATFPLVEGVDESQVLFDVVFFVVVTSVLLQGTTVGLVARVMGATSPAPPRVPSPLEPGQPMPDGTAMRQLTIEVATYADDRAIVDLHLPERALLVLVERDGTFVVPTGSTHLHAGDTVTLLADDATFAATRARLLAPTDEDAH